MKPLALDTPLHVEQLWIAGLRARGALWRLQRLVSMTHFCWHAAYDAFQRARPEATAMERKPGCSRSATDPPLRSIMTLGRHPRPRQRGEDDLARVSCGMPYSPVVEALVSLEVPYYVGGSIASSITGVAQATLDADLVAACALSTLNR